MEITKVSSKGQNIHLDISEDTITKILVRSRKYNDKVHRLSGVLALMVFTLTLVVVVIFFLYLCFEPQQLSVYIGILLSLIIVAGISFYYVNFVIQLEDIFYLSLFLQDMFDQLPTKYQDSFSYSFDYKIDGDYYEKILRFYTRNMMCHKIECESLSDSLFHNADIFIKITMNKKGTKAYVFANY